MTDHNEFILTPITDIITDVVNSSAGIGNGIETFPLCDYVMQSVFIKMTGFQEQKMKSVCWALASNDYEYRYEFTNTPLGECSRHDDKQDVYRTLVKQILKRRRDFKISAAINKTKILQDTTDKVKQGFIGSNLAIWTQRNFNDYDRVWGQVQTSHFASDENTLLNASKGFSLRKVYEDHVYKNRNRIAHNTQSYQQNLPTLRTLIHDDYQYENYFIHFSLLTLIDNIFIKLYEEYLKALEDHAD